MAEAKHYCYDCDTHFRADAGTHADVYHDGGWFQGVTRGNYKDYERKLEKAKQAFEIDWPE